MIARVGREKQRYNSKGERLVAGTVILNDDKSKVLVVSSESHPDCWVLPKGGWETDEPTAEESALRETWEEAGAVGTLTKSLGAIPDMRPPRPHKDPSIPKCEFHFFEMKLDELKPEWPESHRKRTWLGFNDAINEMLRHNRFELAEAIKRSSIKQD